VTPDRTGDVGAVIRRRRMTRRFSSEPVDPTQLASWLDSARRAPSAGFSQGVHFVVCTGSSLDAFWRITGAGEWFAEASRSVLDAPVIVVPVADAAAYTARYAEPDKAGHGLEIAANWPVPFWLTDTAMATQNLLLLVEEAGLGALFFGIFRGESEFLEYIGAPTSARALGAVAIGHRSSNDAPSGSPRRRARRDADEVIHWSHW
jgi:nitroreductase